MIERQKINEQIDRTTERSSTLRGPGLSPYQRNQKGPLGSNSQINPQILTRNRTLIAPGSIPRSLFRTFNFEIWKLKCLGACPEDLYLDYEIKQLTDSLPKELIWQNQSN